MSWEVMSEQQNPCACGKGYVYTEFLMDDWNRTKENVTLLCEECRKQYVGYTYDTIRKGFNESTTVFVKKEDYERCLKLKSEAEKSQQLAQEQITDYLRTHYLELWKNLFQGVPRNKKAIWSKLQQLGVMGFSYTVFCKKVERDRLEEEIESYVSYAYHDKILKILSIDDKNVDLFEASSRTAKQRYLEAQSEMLKGSFR